MPSRESRFQPDAFHADWSPDGKRLAFGCFHPDPEPIELAIADLETGRGDHRLDGRPPRAGLEPAFVRPDGSDVRVLPLEGTHNRLRP